MKTVVLVRHAKFDGEDESLPEHERPLTPRAVIEAQGMAERLARRGPPPQALWCSPAAHARSTAAIFARRFGLGPEAARVDDRLLDASPETLLSMLRELDDRLACVMLVGHNPGLARVADQLSGGEVAKMPLCASAELRFDAARWSQLGEQPACGVRFDDRKKPRAALTEDAGDE